MKELEISAKTVEEAVQQALEHLGVNDDQVEITVIKRGKPGILGLGGEEAKIRVRLLPETKPKADVIKVAQGALELLLKLMGMTAEVQVSKDEIPVSLNIQGEDLGILIGRRGQTLACLQYIIRLIVASKLKAWLPITVDVADYRKRRHEALRSLALRLAERVKVSKHPMTLEPMPPDERRIIHLALANHADVTTQSAGEGEGRKVVILLRKR